MSYCRFSSDDFQSNVYVYKGEAGYVTHVAGYRTVFLEPLPDPLPWTPGDSEGIKAFIEREQKVMRIPRELVPIGLPCDGLAFNEETPGKCADRLEELKGMGYYVPQYAIDALREEESETEFLEDCRGTEPGRPPSFLRSEDPSRPGGG